MPRPRRINKYDDPMITSDYPIGSHGIPGHYAVTLNGPIQHVAQLRIGRANYDP